MYALFKHLTRNRIRSGLSNIAWVIAVFVPLVNPIPVEAASPSDVDTDGIRPRPHSFGYSAALYHNRFIDDVISPVVYKGSSPLFGLFYRNMNESRRHSGFFTFAFYTARLKDADTRENFEITDAAGNHFTLPRSLHQMDGELLTIGYQYLRRVSTLGQGNPAFHLGGIARYCSEEIAGIDRWWGVWEFRHIKSWCTALSLALAGKIEYRLRDLDRFSVDLDFTLLSRVSRAPYYYPITSSTEVPPDAIHYAWMSPAGFLQWSAQISYELWLHPAFGLAGYYRFHHQRVTEPRDLRYVSHTLSFGVVHGIEKIE